MIELAPELLRIAIAHCESTYPSEGCGVILEGAGGMRVRPMSNALARLQPDLSTTAYSFDPTEQLALFEELDQRGETLSCIFHSHSDRGAYFSETDRRGALTEGSPTLTGASYLVISVRSGRAKDLAWFSWEHGSWTNPGSRTTT